MPALPRDLSRREFIRSSALATAALAAGCESVPHSSATSTATVAASKASSADTIRVGVIGCGGRGTGAASDALAADPNIHIVAMGDLFPDHLTSSRAELAKAAPDRAAPSDDRCFTGFDAYKQVLAADVDAVILATPPHFRPIHLAAAIAAGKHVFMEKPVAVDPVGVRSVFASSDLADQKKLCIVAGTQRRHETSYRQCLQRLHDGAIGRIVSAQCYWNQGGLWMHKRRPEWSDMEWQLRNWLYFTWLSGDHIVEQHVHNLDVVNWALRAHPLRALGMGGRQVRTSPEFGHVFDHFTVEYEYPGGVMVTSMARQIDGCASRVEESFQGTLGACTTRDPGFSRITSQDPARAWTFSEENNAPYQQEHKDLFTAIRTGERINEARQVAESTLTAIMGRMSAYTGKDVTWEQALNSTLDLSPPKYAFTDLPVSPVATPGKTALS